jgi:hypothetical protein
MGLIKESFEKDFFVDPKPVTKEDIQKISDYIKSDKKNKKLLKTKQKHKMCAM